MLAGDVAMAETNTTSTTESRNKAIVEASFKAWKDGAGSPFDLLTDDATWTIVGNSVVARTYKSREEFLREVIRPFNARMREPLKPEIRRIYTDGATVIVFFDAKGIARDGQPYVNTYAWFLDMRDGRVTSASAFFDSLAFNAFWARVPPQ
ncbi:nuclear transport factor 2 family protein [Polyangium sp. 15x6]|uniref:nuclear transport factor 2 family protein n=1 Tax=Polyangium sp. 15x6 TaxID=3042687 RepID=UPI0032B512AE